VPAPTHTISTSSSQTSTKILTPTQIEQQGLRAVEAKAVSAPVLVAATALGKAQAQQLGQPNAQYVATTAFIGYLNQLEAVCTESPDRIATEVATATLQLRKTQPDLTYGQVMRVLYQATHGGPKHSCVAELATALAAG
jgi:hypothetical protein